jgi:pilus assembly protein CpaD
MTQNRYNRHLVVAALFVAAAASSSCQPLPASYTSAEAPKTITLSRASQHFTVRFAPGSARLLPADAAQLRAWATAGAITPGDRVSVAASGPPEIAAARFAALSQELLRYKIAATSLTLPSVPPNRAIIDSVRYLVTTPPCPNWSKPPDGDFTNQTDSNFGCANASNLALMVANPADLVAGRELAPADGSIAAGAVQRYETGNVYTPTTFNSAVSSAVQGAISSSH